MKERKRFCFNCRHDIRELGKEALIHNWCEVNKVYMSYAKVMEGWCRHWAKEETHGNNR